MTRAELTEYVSEQYGATPDSPWMDYPDNHVFRHGGSKKWFALIMTIPRAKLKLAGEGDIDVVNLKCDPLLVGSVTKQPGVFPAYHMNKTHWITVALDGSVDAETVKMLLGASFALTAPKIKAGRDKPSPRGEGFERSDYEIR